MAAGTIQVIIGAQAAGYTAAMKEATKDLVRFAESVRSSATPAVREGQTGFRGFTDAMKEFKAEQVQQGRLVGFYVREIADFTGAGKEAQVVLGGLGSLLVEGLAGGIGFGVALEGIKLLVAGYRALGSAAAEETQRAKESMDRFNKSVQTAQLELERLDYQAQGGDVRMFDAIHKTRDGEEQYQKLLSRREALQDRLNRIGREMSGSALWAEGARPAAFRTGEEELKRVNTQIAEIEKGRHDLVMLAQRQIDADLEKAAAKAGRAAGHAYGQEFKNALDAERTRWGLSQFGGYGTDADAARRGDEARAAAGATATGNLWQYSGAGMGQGMGMSASAGMTPKGIAAENAQLDLQAKNLEELQAKWQSYGNAVADALIQIAEGHKSMGDVARDVMRAMLREVLAYAMRALMAKAVETFGNTMAENSKMGPWGWIVGLAAGTAAMAMVMSQAGKIGSAEGGWALPTTGGPYPAVLHRGERVLNEKQNRDYAATQAMLSSLARGDGSGGNHYHLHATAMDAKSFVQWHRDNPGALRDVFLDRELNRR